MFLPSFLRCLVVSVLASVACVAADNDWPVYLGDAGATHYSELTQIDRANVAKLAPAWTYRTGDATDNSQIQCNPLIIDDVLYGTSAGLKLFSLDAATGEERWSFDPFASSPGVPRRRGINRGLVFWREGEEQRILYTAGENLHAIDPATGRLIESFGDNGRVNLLEGLGRDTRGLYLVGTSPGAVYRDLIIVSTRVGEGPGPAAPGHIRAYDVRTGERRWIFHTIPHPGEFGHDTWPPDAWKEIGGANNWAGMTIDHERGLAFIPIGSAAFDFWGGNRLGANLFANCLLVLDAATGERKWHFQFVHHDLWDRDPPAPPVLCTVTRDEHKMPAVAQVTKSGHVWVFHRETGESLFPWREMPAPKSVLEGEVAWPTQPEPLKPAAFSRQRFTEEEATDRTPAARAAVIARLREVTPHEPFSPPSTRGTVVLPGFDGGAEWGGAAVDPGGVLYVNGNEMAWIHQMIPMRVKGASLGQSLYTQLCAACHGPDRAGNPAGNIPGLINIGTKLKSNDITTLLKTGRGTMPAFAFLEPGQEEALVDFLLGAKPAAADNGTRAVNDGRSKTEPGSDVSGGDIPYTTTGYQRFLDPDGYPALRPPWGTLNAIDLNTGEYRWKRSLGEFDEFTARGIPPTGAENYGGPVVTAGGLLFIAATKDERFRAFDKETGKQLWETRLPAGGYATPATYAVNGRQYIVIACGGGKMGTKSGDSYIAFALPSVPPDAQTDLVTSRARPLEPITVNAAFDRGSIGELKEVSPGVLRGGTRHWVQKNGQNDQRYWFYFQLDGVAARDVTIVLADMIGVYRGKPHRTIVSESSRPVVSYDRITWERMDNARWDADAGPWTLHHRFARSPAWIAYAHPYTLGQANRWLDKLAEEPEVKMERIGMSADGRPLRLVTIGSERPKRTVLITSLQHPGEDSSGYVMEGALGFLLSDDPQAVALRREVLFKIIPVVNPDGLYRGHARLNARLE
ncbi:MAG: M14-type cytosolic carboxypeptidase, partial [Opitutaceae bacterium]